MDLHPAVAFGFIVTFFAIGDFISTKTKAFIPSLLVYIMLLLSFVWTGILPQNVVELGGFSSQLTDMVMVVVVINMGSTIGISDLKKEWKTVVIAIGALVGVAASLLTVGSMVFSWEEAVIAAPPLAGGFVAAYEMSTAAIANNRPELSTIALLVLALQSFPAYLLVPSLLKKEARVILGDFRANKTTIETSVESEEKKRRFPPIPEKYNSSTVILAKLGIIATLAVYLSKGTGILFTSLNVPFNITPTIFGLVLGVIFAELGLLENNPLQKSNSYGYMLLASIVGVAGGLVNSTPEEIFAAVPRIFGMVFIGIIGIAIVSILVGKLLGRSWNMSFAIGLNCLLGFPPNYILTQEATAAIGENTEEREYLMTQLAPTMLVGGFTTVTIGSVVLASILRNFIFM